MDLTKLLISFFALMISFFLFWSISIKKRKRLEAEEWLKRELIRREHFRDDRVSMSSKADMGEIHSKSQVNAITMDKNHPRDMALAIKKLLRENSTTEHGNTRDLGEFTGRQKAAVLLITMGTDFGAGICKHLREDEILILANETAKPESYDIKQQIAILKEFQERMAAKRIKASGIKKARKLFI